MKRKLISIILCLAMCCSLFSVALAAETEYPDMPGEDYWSYPALKAAVENGLLQGDDRGNLDPRGTLTRAQMAAVVNRAFGAKDSADISAYSDLPLGAWYYGDMARAVRMGTFRGDDSGLMRPNDPITREQAFAVLARAFLLEDGDEAVLADYADASDISAYARGPMAALVAAGYIRGTQAGLEPKASITREAFAQVFWNMLKDYIRTPGEYSRDVAGNLMVNVPGVILKDMKIAGDLIVGEGVGSGDLTLDGVEVTGRLVVRGGGENSIILKNNSGVGSARISKTGDGGVRLRSEEGCRIEAVYVDDNEDRVILDGEFNQIVVDTDAPVILVNAAVTGLTLKAEDADVKLEGETLVSAVQVEEQAAGAKLDVGEKAKVAALDSAAEKVTISGEGTLETARVSGDDTQVNTEGTSLTVAEDTQGVTENSKTVEGGETVITEKPGSTGETGGDTGTATEPEPYIPPYVPPVEAAVYTVVLEDGTRTAYATLDQALAEADKTVYTDTWGDEGEDAVVIRRHPRIEMTGTGTLADLDLPAGHSLRVYGDLTLSGDLRLEDNLYDETGSTITVYSRVIVCAPAGVVRTTEGAFGYASDCVLQLSGETPADPEEYNGLFIAPDGESIYLTLIWADARVNRDLALGAFHIMSAEDSLNTVTVPAGVTFDLGFSSSSGNFLVEEGATLILSDYLSLFDGSTLENKGTVTLRGWASLNRGSILRNSGTFTAEAYMREFEDGSAKFNSGIELCEGSLLENSGRLILGDGSNLPADGEDDNWDMGGYLRVYDGGKVVNTGTLENGNRIEINDGGSLENSGTLDNRGSLNVDPGAVTTLIRDGETEVEGSARACFFTNTGTLLNGSEEDDTASIRLSGVADLQLGGIITNFGMFSLAEGEIFSEIVELEKSRDVPGEDEDTWGMPWEEDGETWYWKVLSNRSDVTDLIPTKATITKVLENRGKMDIFSVPVTVETGAQLLINEGDIYMGEQYAWEDAPFTYDAAQLLVKGKFVNGSLTGVGEAYNGSDARYAQFGGKFINQGEVVNNGHMDLDDVAYTQSAEGKFTTYNSSGTEISGGSLTVPAGAQFKNEGYLRISDQYYDGEEAYSTYLTDLSGFADFATVWNQEGNDSNWCEYVAEVYGSEGYGRAVTAQASRTGGLRYNRMDFCASMEFTGSVTLDGFGNYWIQGRQGPEATLVVAEGATLTVARGNTLFMDGDSWYDEEEDREYLYPNTLEVKGTLILEPCEQLNEYDWSDCGRVEVWTYGRFLCESGTVVSSGADFLIQYREQETWDEGKDEWVGTGSIARPAECEITGAPQDARYEADVRTYAGFKAALSSAEPGFTRISVRDNRDFTITEDLTIPEGMEVYIEPSSGFELAEGKTLTLAGELRCCGDASLYGDLLIAETGAYYNEQSLEVGDISGGSTAAVTVAGRLVNVDGAELALRATGSLVLRPGGWMEAVTLNAPLTLKSVTGAEAEYYLVGCTFREDLVLEYTEGDGRLIADFGDSATLADGRKIIVKAAGTISDPDSVMDAVELRGTRGLTIQADMTARAGSGAVGSFTLNGVKVELTSLDGQEYGEGSSVQLRNEGENGAVFQVDGCHSRNLFVTGDLSGYDELRIMQGNVYAVGLDALPREITICGMWDETNVTLGAYEAVVSVQRNGEGGFSGVNVNAASGAKLLVKDSWMEWIGDNYCGSSVTVNGCRIDPHIFGCRTESAHGGVYIGIKDDAVQYALALGEAQLTFGFGTDTGSEEKTHLYEYDSEHAWFNAGPETDPHLDLTITLPGSVTVTVEDIPVKPEWNEPQS